MREPLQSAGIFSGYYTIFSEDSSRIAAVDSEHLHVWDAKSGAPIAKLSVAGNARILDISHDGRLVAVASGVTLGASMLISVWQVDAGQREVISASDTIYDARFETDGDHILIWTQDSVARYAHREGLVTESLSLSDYPAPEDGRLRAATRQNGRWAASAEIVDDVFTVTVRSAGGPDRAIVLTAEAADAVFSPDQRTLATISRDGFLQLWVWSPDDLISEACARVGRSMTRAEWSEYFEHEAYEPTCQP